MGSPPEEPKQEYVLPILSQMEDTGLDFQRFLETMPPILRHPPMQQQTLPSIPPGLLQHGSTAPPPRPLSRPQLYDYASPTPSAYSNHSLSPEPEYQQQQQVHHFASPQPQPEFSSPSSTSSHYAPSAAGSQALSYAQPQGNQTLFLPSLNPSPTYDQELFPSSSSQQQQQQQQQNLFSPATSSIFTAAPYLQGLDLPAVLDEGFWGRILDSTNFDDGNGGGMMEGGLTLDMGEAMNMEGMDSVLYEHRSY